MSDGKKDDSENHSGRFRRTDIPPAHNAPAGTAFFEKLTELDRDVNIAQESFDHAKGAFDQTLEDRAHFLRTSNIATFIVEKIKTNFTDKKTSGWSDKYYDLKSAIENRIRITGEYQGSEQWKVVEKTLEETKNNIEFTITADGALEGNARWFVDRAKYGDKQTVSIETKALNLIVCDTLKELGIAEKYVHTIPFEGVVKEKDKLIRKDFATRIRIDLPTGVIQSLIDTEVQKRMEDREREITTNKQKLLEARESMAAMTGEQTEAGEDSLAPQLEKIRFATREKTIKDVMRDILGSALDMRPDEPKGRAL